MSILSFSHIGLSYLSTLKKTISETYHYSFLHHGERMENTPNRQIKRHTSRN